MISRETQAIFEHDALHLQPCCGFVLSPKKNFQVARSWSWIKKEKVWGKNLKNIAERKRGAEEELFHFSQDKPKVKRVHASYGPYSQGKFHFLASWYILEGLEIANPVTRNLLTLVAQATFTVI